MTGWAIVGTGRHARGQIAPELGRLDGVSLIAAVSSDQERGREFAEATGFRYGTSELDRVLDDASVEVVYVSSPNSLHAEHVSRALTAGKHVLCDKPLATDSETVLALISQAEHADLRLGVVHQLRHHDAHLQVREILGSGELGAMVSARIEYGTPMVPSGWRSSRATAGAGVLFNIGIHLFDLMRFLTGREISRLAALGTVPDDDSVETSCLAMVGFDGGGHGTVLADHRSAAGRRTLVVDCEEGSITCQRTTTLTGAPVESTLVIDTGGATRQIAFPGTSIMYRQLASFQNAVVAEGRLDPAPVDALAGTLLVEAAADSVYRGGVFRDVADPLRTLRERLGD